MPNTIKFNANTEANALRVGKWHIGVRDVSKGPTSLTGFYNGINPPSSGYTIYQNKASQGPSIMCPSNDDDLILVTNGIAGASYTTINECFDYFAGQSDKFVMFNPINTMVTDDLVTCFMAGTLPSYPRQGATWYDISNESNSGDLENGAAFDSDGWFDFDGVDDFIDGDGSPPLGNPCTIMALINCNSGGSGAGVIYGCAANGSDNWFEITGTTIRLFATQAADTNNFNVQGGTLICNGTRWYNVAMTLNGATAKIYLNGVEVNTTTRTFTIAGWTGAFDIGRRGNVSQRYFEGSIANVIGNSKLLSNEEILQNHYQAPIVTDNLTFAVDAGNLASYIPSTTTTVSLTVVAGATFTGTLTNGVSFSSGNSGTWDFDGVDDYITFGTIGSFLSTAFTFELWLNVTDSAGSKENYTFNYGYNSNNSLLLVSNTSNTGNANLAAYYRSASGGVTGYGLGSYSTDEIVHLIIRRDSNGLNTAFVNGVSTGVSFSESTTTTLASSLNVQLGWAIPRNKAGAYFKGKIYQFRIYDTALTDGEVGQNYNANVNKFN